MTPLIIFGEGATGAAGAAEALQSGLNAAAFWDGLAPFWPLIIGLAVFAFVYGYIRKTIRKASKGKAA